MSEGNADTVRALFEEWNRGDFDALIARTTDDLEWIPATVATVEGEKAFRGHQGIREFFEQWGATWETWDVDLRECRELGELVVALGHVRAKGSGSGLELNQPVAYVLRFRDGLVESGRSFLDHDEALAAAGIDGEEAA